jgi:hypothetical protein
MVRQSPSLYILDTHVHTIPLSCRGTRDDARYEPSAVRVRFLRWERLFGGDVAAGISLGVLPTELLALGVATPVCAGFVGNDALMLGSPLCV